MDGLSAAASVIAVVQLAGSCLKLSEKWLGPSEFSSSDLAAIKTTLHGFFEAINKFEVRLRAHEDEESREGSLEYLPQVLERCKQALDMVQSFMSNRGFIGKHVIASRFDGKLKASLKALEAAKELFMLALHSDNQFDQIDSRQSSIRNAHAKTCKWVLDNHSYRDWLDSGKLREHCGFIWIKGKPGAGKSTLMKFLLFQAKTTMKDTTIISFFFNARGGDLEKSTIGMYRTLLFQLLTQRPELQDNLGRIVRRTFDSHLYEWGIEPLKAVTQEIIYALDECDEDEVRDMISFFAALGELTASMNIQFRVCFSSRYYPHINIATGLDLLLESEEGHAHDIITYVESELKIGKSERAQKVRAELERKAQGVFMWAVLVVGILNKEFSRGNVHKLLERLRDIPGDLHALFRSILARDGERKDELLLCIQWVLFSKEPLKPEQLYFAVFSGTEPEILCEYDPDDVNADDIQRFLTSSSKGLVEVTRSKIPTVQFIHESVKDFLFKSNGLQELWPDLGSEFEGKSHDRLKDCCLKQLRIDISESLGIDEPLPKASSRDGKELRQLTTKRFPFLEYAVNSVLYHADLAEAGGISQSRFLQDFELTSWVMLNNLFEQHQIRRHPKTVSLLYILAQLNCASLIGAYTMKQSCLKVEGSRYSLPLFAAFATQSKEAVSALLTAEAHSQPDNVLLQNLARKYSTWEGNCMAVSRDFQFVPNKSALSFAAKSGDPEMLAFLLASGELDIESKDTQRQTPLISAVTGDNKTAVEVLIEMGAEFNRKNTHRHTPPAHAAATGRDETVRILLANGANIEARDRLGRTPLIHACVNETGRTPLMLASIMDDEKVIRILLELGANIEERGRQGRTPLVHACIHGRENAVRVLLEKGARLEANDADGWTPLIAASVGENERIVEILLEKGADIEAKDIQGRTALLHASSHGHGPVVRLLLDNRADIDAKNLNGITALILASQSGKEDAVRMLLEKGANIEAGRPVGTSLACASRSGHAGVVKILLDNGASIDTRTLRLCPLTFGMEHSISMTWAELCRILCESLSRARCDTGSRDDSYDFEGRPSVVSQVGR
ncbi:hypothetical protein V8F06_003157 [Rhypophila decipiens]